MTSNTTQQVSYTIGDKAISDDFELAIALKFNLLQLNHNIPNTKLLVLFCNKKYLTKIPLKTVLFFSKFV
jgi:hypothetical protein